MMDRGLIFLISALLTYRVTRFLIEDTLIEGSRHWVLSKLYGPPFEIDVQTGQMKKRSKLRQKLAELLTCPFCLSVWVAAGATVVVDRYYDIPLPLFYWGALSAAALAFWRYIEQN